MAVVAAACGNSTVGSDDGGGGGWRAKLPVSSVYGAGAGGASAATMKAEVATDAVAGGAPAPAPMIAPYQPIEYQLAASAEAPATSAEAYQLKLVKDGVADRVAKALGVDAGRVEATSGYGDWYYGADAAVSSTIAVACAPDTTCEAPTEPPLEGVPSAAEAKAKVEDIVRSLGVDVDQAGFTVEGEDGRSRTVTATPSVGGVDVPMLQTSVTFGAHGQVVFAHGFLFDVEALGRYPLVSLQDAFDRYQHGFGPVATGTAVAESGSGTVVPPQAGGGGSSGSAAGCAADGPDCGVAQPGVAVAPGEPAPDGGPVMTVEPQPAPPTEPPTTVETRIVEVTGAHLVLEPVATGCLDDPIYLVPAFELQVDEAPFTIGTVTAVADEALDTSGPSRTEARDCPEDQVEEAPAGKSEPAPVPPDAGSVEPQPAPNRP